MINFNNYVTTQDLCYIMHNMNSLTRMSRIYVNLYSKKITETINKKLDKDIKDSIEQEKQYVMKHINNSVISIKNTDVRNKIRDMFDNIIYKCESEDNEGLRNIFKVIDKTCIEIKKYTSEEDKTDIKNSFITLFEWVLPWKLIIYSIACKSNVPLPNMYTGIVKDISTNISSYIDMIYKSDNVEEITYFSYLLISSIYNRLIDDYNDTRYGARVIRNILSIGLQKPDMSIVEDRLLKTFDANVNPFDLIPDSTDIDLPLNLNANFEPNYSKTEVSAKACNDSLCMGDDIFNGKPHDLDKLLTDIYFLNENLIKAYTGFDKINFSISESMVGYLKSELKLKVCKIMKKDNRFFTLVNYEDNILLLFNDEKNKCYGISLNVTFEDKGRFIVEFTLPENVKYEFAI